MIKRLLIGLEDECVEYETYREITSDEAHNIVMEVLTTYSQFENLIIDEVISNWEEEINDNSGNIMFNFKVKGYFATDDEIEDDDFYPETFNSFKGELFLMN